MSQRSVSPEESITHLSIYGHRIRVAERQGTDPEQPPLLLFNGIGARMELLDPFVDRLDPAIGVIRIDVPGVGGSSPPRMPYRFWHMAAMARRVVRLLGHRRVDVLGISWGGGLAQQFAFQHRQMCRRLVLCATATGSVMVPAHPRILAKMATPRRYHDPDFARDVAAELYGGNMREQPEEAAALLGARASWGSSWGYTCQLLAGWGWSSLPALSLIHQKTLVLAGADDPLIPLVNSAIITRLMPRASRHVYDDGHLGLVTSADELGPVVSDFLLQP